MSSPSILAAWSLEPSYYLRVERNDNIHLSTQNNELAVTGGTFSPAIKVIMEEEDQSLVADLDWQATRYKNHSELDRNEGKAGINWRKATELSVYGITTSYVTKSNLDTTLETSGIDQVVEQKTANISPNWRYQFGERWNVSVNLSYTDSEYDEQGAPIYGNYKVVKFINYVEQSGSLELSRELSERDSMSVTYYQSKYEGEGNGLQLNGPASVCFFLCTQASERKQDYDYSVWQLGYQHNFEENSRLSLQAGSNVTTIHNQTRAHYFDHDQNFVEIPPAGNWVVSDSEQKSQVYNVSYTQKNEISRFETSAGSNRVASSTGGLNETDTAKVSYTRNLTERLSWSMDLNRTKYRPDQDTNVQFVADYTRITATPALYYSINTDWSTTLGYRYSERDIETDLLPRESNAVYFTLSWRAPQFLSTN